MGFVMGGNAPLRIMADGQRLALSIDGKNVMLAKSAMLSSCSMDMAVDEIENNTVGGWRQFQATRNMSIDLSFQAWDVEFHEGKSIDEVFNADMSIRELFGMIADKVIDRE